MIIDYIKIVYVDSYNMLLLIQRSGPWGCTRWGPAWPRAGRPVPVEDPGPGQVCQAGGQTGHTQPARGSLSPSYLYRSVELYWQYYITHHSRNTIIFVIHDLWQNNFFSGFIFSYFMCLTSDIFCRGSRIFPWLCVVLQLTSLPGSPQEHIGLWDYTSGHSF